MDSHAYLHSRCRRRKIVTVALSVIVTGMTLTPVLVDASSPCLIQKTHTEAAASEDIVYWEEEQGLPSTTAVSKRPKQSEAKRRLVWSGKLDDDMTWMDDGHRKKQRSKPKADLVKPHPMRTDLWQLRLSTSPKEAILLGAQNKTLILEFSDTGFVRSHAPDSDNIKCTIGKWKLRPSGLSWQIPVQTLLLPGDADSDEAETVDITVLHYHADLILNPFGTCPRMVRGMVTRDRFLHSHSKWFGKEWFRPVIATFTAEGIGQDTSDVSYRERGFGLLPSTTSK